jgi:hypothetical protein
LSLTDPDHMPRLPGRPQAQPLKTTSVVIYATLLLLAVTIPRALVNWSKNFEPNVAQETVLRVAEAIQSMSQRVGADWLYREGRKEFLELTGKRDD